MGVRILLGTPFRLAYANRQSGLAQTQLFGDSTSPASTRLSATGRSSPTGRGSGLKPRSVQDRGLPAAPTPLPVSEGHRRRRLAQRKSVGPTNRRSRYRNSQRLPNTNKPSCSSKAEQPADNRQTADRYRAGGPNKETDMHDPLKRGVLWTPSVQPIGSAVDF
jgi:hypothetical protein